MYTRAGMKEILSAAGYRRATAARRVVTAVLEVPLAPVGP